MESSSGTIYHPHWRYISRSHHLHFHSVSKHSNKCKSLHVCSSVKCLVTYLAQTLWMPNLMGMILWYADVFLLHQKTPFFYSKSWHGLVQCSDQQWTCTVFPVVLHQLRVCYHFWTYQSNCTYFASVNHCSHTVLEVFNGFMPLVHMQPTKTGLLNTDFLWNIWQVVWPY